MSRDRHVPGALLGGRPATRWRPGSPSWWALGGFGVRAMAPPALLAPVPPAVVVGAYVVAVVGLAPFDVPWFTATQREVEPRLLARPAGRLAVSGPVVGLAPAVSCPGGRIAHYSG